MTISWTENATVKLVMLYGRHECLRNPFHPDFNNQLCRYRAYKQIVDRLNILGLTVCDCVKRISFIKKQYCYELSKISAAISCGKFYKPRACWFEMMHELLFPVIQACDCLDDFKNDADEEEEAEEEDDEDEYANRVYDDNEVTGDYNYYPSYEESPVGSDLEYPCEVSRKLHRHRSANRSGARSRSKTKGKTEIREVSAISSVNVLTAETYSQTNFKRRKTFITSATSPLSKDYGKIATQTENRKVDRGSKVVSSKNSTKGAQTKRKQMDACNRTTPASITQSGAQTDRKFTRDANTCFDERNKENIHEKPVGAGHEREDVSVECDERGKKKHHDEFDLFGKSIASQLRSLGLESAITLEKRIQEMMTEERLCNMQDADSGTVPCESLKQECKCTCKECKDTCKEEMCSCGLPVSKCLPPIAVKTNHCCGFYCK